MPPYATSTPFTRTSCSSYYSPYTYSCRGDKTNTTATAIHGVPSRAVGGTLPPPPRLQARIRTLQRPQRLPAKPGPRQMGQAAAPLLPREAGRRPQLPHRPQAAAAGGGRLRVGHAAGGVGRALRGPARLLRADGALQREPHERSWQVVAGGVGEVAAEILPNVPCPSHADVREHVAISHIEAELDQLRVGAAQQEEEQEVDRKQSSNGEEDEDDDQRTVATTTTTAPAVVVASHEECQVYSSKSSQRMDDQLNLATCLSLRSRPRRYYKCQFFTRNSMTCQPLPT
mmetsp:Transcript_16649/g.46627  ORF Transcript_16649/g.46627 Transcript_16649/m.46627 type:complete len:286 (-) Transcript_16649:348-1205(-)